MVTSMSEWSVFQESLSLASRIHAAGSHIVPSDEIVKREKTLSTYVGLSCATRSISPLSPNPCVR